MRGGVGIYYDTTIDNLRLFERADLGPPGAELFLVGVDLSSARCCRAATAASASARARRAVHHARQALALVPAVRADLEAQRVQLRRCRPPSSASSRVSGPLFSTDFQVPYSIQYAFGVQRELPWNMLLQADFNYRKGVHEVMIYDVNQADQRHHRPDHRSAFGNTVPYADSSGFSTYKALLVRVDRRFANGFQMTAQLRALALQGASATTRSGSARPSPTSTTSGRSSAPPASTARTASW